MSDATDRRTTDYEPRTPLLAIALVYLATRVTLATVRQPFFDELFTVWIAQKPIPALFSALRYDSGPPLYYLIAKAVFSMGDASVAAGRALSLGVSLLLLLALVARRWGRPAVVAAAMLAVFPPHVYFSGEARGYSLCALSVGLAALRLDRWREEDDRVSLTIGAGALVFAASSHYYGVLLFPVPFVLGVVARNRRAIVEGFLASSFCGILFVPGFLLASLQPREATAWFAAGSPFADVCLTLGSLQHLGFAAPYPPLLVGAPPLWMQALSVMAIALAVVRTPRSPRAIRFAIITLVPVAIATLFAAAGRSIYFPVRFESVLALPFVVWIACALEGWEPPMRRVLIGVAIALGIVASANMIATHARRGSDPYRTAAQWMRERVDPRSTIVASSYAFLEVESQVDASWNAQIVSFPPAQALHPGWHARTERARLEKFLERLQLKRGDAFIWVGEERSEEANVIARKAKTRVLYRRGGVVVLAVNEERRRPAPAGPPASGRPRGSAAGEDAAVPTGSDRRTAART